MNFSVYQAAAAMNANLRWQELIAENLNASSIPGFKRQQMSFEAVQAGYLKPRASGVNPAFGEYSMPRAVPVTSFTPGELRPTGSKTDLALEGAGFFAVQLPGDQTGYTRDGGFHITAQGQLVTKQGFPVLGENGPIQVDPRGAGPITVSAAGEVNQGAVFRDKLRVTEFPDPRVLTSGNGGYFLASDPNHQGRPAQSASVTQGFLEGSNVSVMLEMANMMTAMRTFEANQRIIQMNDERVGRVLTDLGPS